MKAIRIHEYGGPEKLGYEDVPDPKPNPGQVLVRVRAASVNPVDHKLASGDFRPPKLPWIPGGDFSGVVEAIGAGVTNPTPGDAVYGNSPSGGAYAEYVVVHIGTIAPKPAALSHTEAASVPIAGQTAWQALFEHGRLRPGQTVLIHGAAGGVGTFAVQLAHWKKANVLATVSPVNAEYVRALGADELIDYHQTRFESVAHDVDLVLDLVGGETQARSFEVLRPGGYLVAASQPPPEKTAAEYNVRAMMMFMQASTTNLSQLAELFNAGTIKTAVTRTYPLSQARDAWQQIFSSHMRGKIVLEMPGAA